MSDETDDDSQAEPAQEVEPEAETEPTQETEPEAEVEPRRPRGGLIAASILIVATVFVAAVVLGGMWLTGQWSGPSTSDPSESVDGFLTAMLEDRDGDEARSYLCQTLAGDVTAALSMIDTMDESAEDDHATQFSWSDITEHSRSDDTAVVTANVTHDLTGETAEWTFAVVTGDPDDAWRVCGIDPGADEES